ncbi:MAG TPA: thiamine pyrophosphate-dependent dehydrogenase E1 component subunit alpha, partial [Thermoleophilia bacterium]|nr:thiamine pyrophosphate-dependent dehydrogenase E1 component subunit alpha [Thermoleophilia bacterium]
YVVSTHRGHGHVLAKGGDPARMMAEVFGRVGGYCRGKGGTMHMADSSRGILGTNGIVGASLPIATGVGLYCQYMDTDLVSVCFFGDGASNRGTFHESLDLASVWNLPVIYVCENNFYGMSTSAEEHMNIADIADRGSGYGIPGVVVDGNDVLAVREVSAGAIERAREGGGPTLIECKTWRHHGHFTADPAYYRDPEVHNNHLKNDPILRCAAVLLCEGLATQAELDTVHNEAIGEMDAAVEFSKNSPWPSEDELVAGLFA